jgi:hypothetical protein
MRRVLVERATRPVQAKRAIDAGYGDLIAASSVRAPRRLEPTEMPPLVQAKMESAFGADFSDVRVHTDSARAVDLSALAFTQGNDIHVAPGQWAPETTKGQELLGHELAHVVQQRAGRVTATAQRKGASLNDEPELEREADTLGARAARGVSGAPVEVALQRKEAPGGAPLKTGYDDVVDSARIQRKGSGLALPAEPTIQLQTPKQHPNQAATLATLATLRGNAENRFNLTTSYAEESLAVGDLTRDKLTSAIGVYRQAYDTFRGVLNRAQKEAQNQQRWTDIIIGVICGTAAGLAAAFVLPSTPAGWFALTLAEAGTAAASSAGQGVLSAGLGALASSQTQVAGQNISSAALDPMIQEVAMWQRVSAIYRSGLEMTPLIRASHNLTTVLGNLIADVRVFEAGGTTALTETRIAATTAQLVQQDAKFATGAAELQSKITELQTLRSNVQAIDPAARSAVQVERDIWILWMSSLPYNSNILDLDAIEDHIGPNGLHIVDFGSYTSDADENEAIDQARTTAMFLDAEANNTDVPPGQVVGGPTPSPARQPAR